MLFRVPFYWSKLHKMYTYALSSDLKKAKIILFQIESAVTEKCVLKNKVFAEDIVRTYSQTYIIPYRCKTAL